MATTNQSTTRFPVSKEKSGVRALATFSASGDVTNWVRFTGDVIVQAFGPVDAATIAVERSTIDTSGNSSNPVEVDDFTGTGGGGITGKVDGVGDAWYRAKNKDTFGPANTV